MQQINLISSLSRKPLRKVKKEFLTYTSRILSTTYRGLSRDVLYQPFPKCVQVCFLECSFVPKELKIRGRVGEAGGIQSHVYVNETIVNPL